MSLSKLVISELRNIRDQSIDVESDCIIFTGDNGSGKSSILEAIYVLGRGASFRSKDLKNLINFEANEFVCFGEIYKRDELVKVGISKKRSLEGTPYKIDGKQVKNLSEVASEFPLLLVTPQTFSLINGGPKERRKFLDWGVFHVEHSYKDIWQKWRKSLLQRNKLLKSGKISRLEIESWDKQFANLSEELTKTREIYFKRLLADFKEQIESLFCSSTEDVRRLINLFEKTEIVFERGWNSKSDLKDLLIAGFENDKKRGFTGVGPHKADIRFLYKGLPVIETLSRGQQKLLVSTLLLTQLRILKASNGLQCTVLIDDIGAELDIGNQINMVESGLIEKAQIFVTVLERSHAESIYSRISKKHKTKMFHVEHGQIKNLC